MDASNQERKVKPSHDGDFRKIIEGLSLKFIRLRALKDESMENVAQDCGLTRGTVFKTEHPGETEDLSLATVWAIAKHFGFSLSQMFAEIEKIQSTHLEGCSTLSPSARIDSHDELAFQLVDEVTALQFRADLAEAACLNTKSEQQLEILTKHSSRLRLKRYQLLMRKKVETNPSETSV